MRITLRTIGIASILSYVLILEASAAPVATPWADGPIACYSVPPISSIKRLPDVLPSDGTLSDRLRIIAAKGEYEPASFVVVPRENITKFELKASELISPKGKIPVSNIDIKVVKCWYQAGTAWYSYFGDSNRRELTPELLLKDDTLIKVDKEKKENYLRVNDKYMWISYSKDKAKEAFNYLTTQVKDSDKLLPVRLKKGENKQFWITVKVPKKASAGIYRGRIDLIADGKFVGKMKLELKVLPYELPMPKTYYNLDNDYLVTIYGTGIYDMCYRLGMDQKVIDTLQMKIYKNLLAHNVFNCRSDLALTYQKDRALAIERLKNEIEMMKKAGFIMKPLLSRGWSYPSGEKSKDDPKYKKRIDDLAKTLKDAVGHSDIYITSWDEASSKRVKIMREYSEYTSSKGLKLWMTTHKGRHFDLAGHLIGYANHGGWPERERADMWHSIGSKIASYAGPHTGPENPDVFRHWEGLNRYKAHYDGSFNYKLYSQLHPTLYKKYKSNVWNDFMGGAFRGFNMVYPTTNGPIDTLAWEGFREGIDDVRYATKLKQEAAKAIASGNYKAMHAGKKALIWLELLDAKTADLNTVRLEMIEYIDKIRKVMGEKE